MPTAKYACNLCSGPLEERPTPADGLKTMWCPRCRLHIRYTPDSRDVQMHEWVPDCLGPIVPEG